MAKEAVKSSIVERNEIVEVRRQEYYVEKKISSGKKPVKQKSRGGIFCQYRRGSTQRREAERAERAGYNNKVGR